MWARSAIRASSVDNARRIMRLIAAIRSILMVLYGLRQGSYHRAGIPVILGLTSIGKLTFFPPYLAQYLGLSQAVYILIKSWLIGSSPFLISSRQTTQLLCYVQASLPTVLWSEMAAMADRPALSGSRLGVRRFHC